MAVGRAASGSAQASRLGHMETIMEVLWDWGLPSVAPRRRNSRFQERLRAPNGQVSERGGDAFELIAAALTVARSTP